MKFRVNQISLVAAIIAEIDRQAKEDGIADLPMPAQRKMDAIIEGANAIVAEFNTEDRPSQSGMGLMAWLASDDTGLSSKAMAHHLCGVGIPARDIKAHPHDPDDFGRCHRFLEAVPEAREKLPKMASVSPVWAQLVAHWDELTALFLREFPSGRAPELYARMKALGC